MRTWIAFALLAVMISGCVSESASEPRSDSATVPSQPGGTDPPQGPDVMDVTYVPWRETGFTVIKSATADELFHSVVTCTSHEGGYTVQYPVSWHTNEGGEAPGCSWFGPEPFAHGPATLVAVRRPLDVPIQLGSVRGGLAQVGGGPRPPLDDQVVIGGVEGDRTEAWIGAEPPWWRYAYSALLDPAFDGLTFMAETTSAWEDESRDYVLNKAVLDRMMATLEFTTGDAPPPVVLPTPSVPYVEKEGYPFTVLDSAEADRLFETPDTCTNPMAGYTVTFPDDWYTNTAIGDWPACSWFSPTYYEVAANPNHVPPQVAIVLFSTDGVGHTDEPQYSVVDRLTIGGYEAWRAEQIGSTAPSGVSRSTPPRYSYVVSLPPTGEIPSTLVADTRFEGAADYELNKAVLDRMMATLEFENRPERVRYSEKEGYPFTVIENAEADQLFETPDTCTNPAAGYTVTFPDDWYTNTEIGETPACSWFTPDYFEVIDPAEAPDEIWISIDMVDGVVAYTSLTQIFLNEDVLLSGVTARRVESNPSPRGRPHYRAYDYHAIMGSQDQGPSFMAVVDSDAADDYELGKAVLDRIMASLQFDD